MKARLEATSISVLALLQEPPSAGAACLHMSDDEKRKSSPVFERGSWIRVGANALLVIAGIGLAYAMLDAAGDHVSQSLASKVPMPLR